MRPQSGYALFFLRRPLVGLGREDVRRRRRVLVVRIVRARQERVVLLRDARHLLVLLEVVGLGEEAQAARLQGARGVGQELVGELEGVDAVLCEATGDLCLSLIHI